MHQTMYFDPKTMVYGILYLIWDLQLVKLHLKMPINADGASAQYVEAASLIWKAKKGTV